MVIERGLMVEALKKSSGIYGTKWNASFQACVKQAHRFAVQYNIFGPSGVSHLLRSQCPNAVIFRVPKIVIQSLQTMLRTWTKPHISDEVFKGFPPQIKRDASPTIMFVGFSHWVCRAIYHALPGYIFRTFPCSSSVSMFFGFMFQAAAGLGSVLTSKRDSWNRCLLAARALTDPVNAPSFVGCSANHSQSPKDLIGQINATVSPSCVTNTSARARVSALQVSGMGDNCVATHTQTLPTRFTSRRIGSSSKCFKITVHLPCKIEWLHKILITYMPGGLQLCPSLARQ